MKNAEIRQRLEGEISALKSRQSPLGNGDFEKYLTCLKRLSELNVQYALGQERIVTCACGDLGGFVGEFFGYVTPLLQKTGKEMSLPFVHERCT
ncbi:MAG: hypothetical protein IKY44_00820, partial [Clostridia bacterium]|nr:hypothetical protein [Clostridia bacterium]